MKVNQFYSMRRSNSELTGHFVLPNGMSTNSQELRSLQKKMLQKHYQPHPQQTRTLEPALPQQQMADYDSYTRQAIKKQQSALSQDLMGQMRTKSQIMQLSKQSNMNEQHQLMQHINKLDSLEKQKEKHFNRKYAMQAQEDLKLKQSNKMKEARRDQIEKEMYKNRYSVGDLTQGQFQKNHSYSNPTQQYIREVDKAVKDRERSQPNPEQLHNSSFKITRKTQNLGGLDFMFKGTEQNSNYVQQNSYFNEMKVRENKERSELKSTLLAQMREKDQNKKMQKSRQFFNPYTSHEYNGKHHPINNPVDYRVAHDNRYLMKELGAFK